MKKLMFFVVAVAMSVISGVALADDAAVARWNLAKKSAGFVGGLLSGFLFHEAGHELVARIENTDMSWSFSDNKWYAKTDSNGRLRNIAFAGFGAEIISTEIILGSDKIPKDNSFVLGWLAYNILNSFLYPLRNELQGGYGDLETLRKTGVDTGFVEIGLVAYGLVTAYRVYHNPKFIPYIRATREEVSLGIGWRF